MSGVEDSRNEEPNSSEPSNNYEILRSWTVGLNVPSVAIGAFTDALEQAVDGRSGVWYEPDYEDGLTRCRYEWFVRLAGAKQGARITLMFLVGDQDLVEISAALSLGRTLKGRSDLVTAKVANRVIKTIEATLGLAMRIMDGSALVERNTLVHLSAPRQLLVTKESSSGGHTVFPSAMGRPQGDRVLAMSVPVQTYSREAARDRASAPAERLAVVMSVLSGQSFTVTNIDWPRSKKWPQISAEPFSLGDAYPRSRFDVDLTSRYGLPDLSKEAATAVEIVSDASALEHDVWLAMHALARGIELHSDQPTLASVAYSAALSSTVSPVYCVGEVSCNKCGERPRHYETGDAKSITVAVSLALGLNEDETKECEKLVRRVYSRQRSSYVHDGKLRHAEIDGHRGGASGRPEAKGAHSPVLGFSEDLSNIQMLARRFLVSKLSDSFEDVHAIAVELSDAPIRARIHMTSQITVSDFPVGLLPPYGG